MKKRSVAIIITAILAIAVLTVVFAGAKTLPSVSEILDYIVGKTNEAPEGADYNKDGKIDVLDATEAKRGSDGKLKLDSLTLSDGTLEPEFSSSIYSYTVDLPDGRPVIPLVEAESDVHDVEIYQAFIPDGQNEGTARITVSEGSETNVYTVTFRRRAENGFVLQYDDRYDISSRPELEGQTGVTYVSSDPAKVSVDETGMLKACARTETPVTVTASKDGNALYTLSVDKVVKARINLFFITGQSTAQGCYDTSDTSGNRIPTDVQHSLIEDIGRSGAVYGFDVFPRSENTQVYSLRYNLYDMNEHAKQGFEPSLGKYFYEYSGEKIVMFQSAYSGAPIESWLDTERHSEAGTYTSSKYNFYDKTQQYYPVLLKQLGDNFEIVRTCNVWYQGGTGMSSVYDYETSTWINSSNSSYDSSKLISEQRYYDYFMMMNNDMAEDFGVETNFIILNRLTASAASAESRALQLLTDLVPVKQAQLALTSNGENIVLVSRYAEHARMYSSTDTESYGYGFIGLDNTHSNQIGHNENGRITGTNAFMNIFGRFDPSSAYIDLLATNGRDRLTSEDTVELEVGSIYRTGAIAEPIAANYTASWSSSNEDVATVNMFGKVTAISEGNAVITVSYDNGLSQSFNVRVVQSDKNKPYEYLWDFNDMTSSADKNDFALSDYSVERGAAPYYSIANGMITIDGSAATGKHPDFLIENPICVDSNRNWTVEWRAKLTKSSPFIGNPTPPEATASSDGFIYLAYATNFGKTDSPLYPVRISLGSGKNVYLSYEDHRTDAKSMNTWKICYTASDHTFTLYIKINGEFTVVSTAASGDYEFRMNCLFGRFVNGGVGFGGQVDYIKFSAEAPEKPSDIYQWDFSDLDDLGYENKLTVSQYCVNKGTDKNYTLKNGIYSSKSGVASGNRTDFALEKPITLDSNRSWSFEWRAKLGGSSVLFGGDTPDGATAAVQSYIYLAYTAEFGGGYDYSLKFSYGSGYTYLKYGDHKSDNTSWNTWKLSYDRETKILKLEIMADGAYETVDSAVLPDYTTTLECMFGRLKDASNTLAGSVDYIRAVIGQPKN